MVAMSWWVPLCAALIGGLIAIAGGMAIEAMKQCNERRSLAVALRGEMLALVNIVKIRRYEFELEQIIQGLRAGSEFSLPPVRIEKNYFPIYSENASKIGLLSPDISEKVSSAYIYANSFIEDFTSPLLGTLTAESLSSVEEVLVVLRLALKEAEGAARLIEKNYRLKGS